MNNPHKLGQTLVSAGIISQKQLDKSLSVQRSHPTKSIGEIVSKLYNIQEGVIEATFVKAVLSPAIRNFIYSELKKKINTPGFNLLKAVLSIDLEIQRYKRITIASKTFTLDENSFYKPSKDKKFLSKINCTIKSIVLHTAHNARIDFNDVLMEFDIQSQKLSMDNPSLIMEAKIRLNQILKKNQING